MVQANTVFIIDLRDCGCDTVWDKFGTKVLIILGGKFFQILPLNQPSLTRRSVVTHNTTQYNTR